MINENNKESISFLYFIAKILILNNMFLYADLVEVLVMCFVCKRMLIELIC